VGQRAIQQTPEKKASTVESLELWGTSRKKVSRAGNERSEQDRVKKVQGSANLGGVAEVDVGGKKTSNGKQKEEEMKKSAGITRAGRVRKHSWERRLQGAKPDTKKVTLAKEA